MNAVLEIDKLTQAEKISAMELLWEDLSQSESEYEVPAWHETELRLRERELSEGKDTFIPWDEAKKILRERVT